MTLKESFYLGILLGIMLFSISPESRQVQGQPTCNVTLQGLMDDIYRYGMELSPKPKFGSIENGKTCYKENFQIYPGWTGGAFNLEPVEARIKLNSELRISLGKYCKSNKCMVSTAKNTYVCTAIEITEENDAPIKATPVPISKPPGSDKKVGSGSAGQQLQPMTVFIAMLVSISVLLKNLPGSFYY